MSTREASAEHAPAAQPPAAARQMSQPLPESTVPDPPALAPGVHLRGEMSATGFVSRQWLVERDGHFVQLSELLYRILELADGERTLEHIARGISDATEWIVTASQVRQLVEAKLMPLGLIKVANDGATPPPRRVENAPLQLTLRRRVFGPRVIDPAVRRLQILYTWPVLVPVLLLAAVAHVWLHFVHGVASSVQAALYMPGGLLILLAATAVAGLFHELGHAAALRYGGGSARAMGVGLYLVYPTFYTDMTDAYRLGRWARVRTDLGGIYFHLLFVLALIALYLASGQEILLAVAMLVDLDILYQCVPYVRLDGYWALADLTGIPDFLSQIGPFLRSVLPFPGAQGTRLPALRRWVRVAFGLYILLALPLLAVLCLVMLKRLPVFMASAWKSLLYQGQALAAGWRTGDAILVTASISQALLLALMLSGAVYVVFGVCRALAQALWRWSTPTPLRRFAGLTTAVAGAGAVLLLWAPDLPFARKPTVDGVLTFPVTERRHVQNPVAYPQDPPVGGNHAPIWQNCGFYSVPVANENVVHSLEHGAVWIAYRPDLPADQVQTLRDLARQDHILVSPLRDLSASVVASAWGRQLRLESAQDPSLAQFVSIFRNGAQAPERGGPCAGGVGIPSA